LSTNQNEVTIPASVGNQDYPDIDVTALVQDMVSDPANSFGFLLRLTNENYYARMLFASGDNPDTAEHPHLDVCWSFAEAVKEVDNVNDFLIFPNPSSGIVNLQWHQTSDNFKRLTIIDCMGRMVMSMESGRDKAFNSLIGQQSKALDLSMLPKGVYAIRLEGNNMQMMRKLMIQ
jgi:hypothetical protein